TDIEVLNLLISNIAGFEIFNAPLSDDANKLIYYSTVINLLCEDTPHLIIQ
ncbi:17161_t:CDS:1, partial [Dentiscutata erythropus]